MLNLTRTVAKQGVRTFTHTTWVSGPPRTRIAFAEKVAHGVLISAGVLAGPMWILVNIENYKKRD
uniref:Cytochrome c oxidase polypeptide n=1 Tax=Paracalanus parvus TaxID=187406 RepID=A0A0U2T8Y1_9MAXI|nr:cytochrome c oxidase polypeptide [Paracalanus parvus]